MQNTIPHAYFYAIGVAIGIPLLIIGDRIRRKTRGRIRHLEIHLIAWLPGLILEAAMYVQVPFPIDSKTLLFPVICAAFVYLAYFACVAWYRLNGDEWERSEERLDRKDALILKEQQRRERIESYKHKKVSSDNSADSR